MHIENLRISNFRGITEVRLEQLGNMVIIAGQNGSGKSCIFDAIRLLKSIYGGYQANEWQQWMGEFQIAINSSSADFKVMMNDVTRELRVSCDFRLAAEERNYIQTHADELLRDKIWRTILPEAYGWGGYRMAMFAAQFRDREPEVAARAKSEYPALMAELAAPLIRGEFFVKAGDTLQFQNSLALSVAFSTFRPEHIGVIDYHGAQRHYGRENVQGINLNLDPAQQQGQAALYNYASKYTNVKAEMAASYVRELFAAEAGIPRPEQSSLTNTLKDLFATFFPDKKFLGPTPTKEGRLDFPVETVAGSRHDLDELSAGEKEILYGYLRIRNSAPRHSIILLDEPELHLNPRLIRGLPQFYQKNLGQALGNQMWLVTHSDALLREVVGREKFNVFHMLPCGNVPKGEGQLKPLSATADLELALVDLVGDLASYRPGGKVVIFEGGGDSDFDQRVAATLFPELQQQANLISGSNKVRVRALHETLENAAQRGQLPFKFYSVTDRDSEPDAKVSKTVNSFTWDVYHIENYFLIPKYINRVLRAVGEKEFADEGALWDKLRECAEGTLPQMVRHELSEYANRALVGAIDTRTDPRSADVTSLLLASIGRSVARIEDVRTKDLGEETLAKKELEIRTKYNASLANGTWTTVFRGRDVLRRFTAGNASSCSYEVFRNLLLSQMSDDSFRPPGMEKVVNQILAQ